MTLNPPSPSTNIPTQLSQVQLFKDLSEVELRSVWQMAHTRNYDAGEFLFLQGDPAERLYVLRSGRIKVLQLNPDGQQLILRMLGPWTLFAAVTLARKSSYPVSAQTVDACQALSWTRQDLMTLITQIPHLALNAMDLMAEHVQEFQDRYRELATERVERRLARTLLRLASQTGLKISEGVLINLPLTRQDLGEMIGATLYTVSRILSQWESQGLVLSSRERVIIHFPHGLVRIAEDLPDDSDSLSE